MLDNRIKFSTFTTVKTLHSNPQKGILIETLKIQKTDLKYRQQEVLASPTDFVQLSYKMHLFNA